RRAQPRCEAFIAKGALVRVLVEGLLRISRELAHATLDGLTRRHLAPRPRAPTGRPIGPRAAAPRRRTGRRRGRCRRPRHTRRQPTGTTGPLPGLAPGGRGTAANR